MILAALPFWQAMVEGEPRSPAAKSGRGLNRREVFIQQQSGDTEDRQGSSVSGNDMMVETN
jgi:hypothetical protein